MKRLAHLAHLALGALVLTSPPAAAGQANLSPLTRSFVAVDDSVVALAHVRVIDGTGAPAKEDQAVLIRDGVIQAVGPASDIPIPPGAKTLDLSDHTVLPGLVMVHEHMFYPTGEGQYAEQSFSFPRLYLAGGATTIRTAGSLEPYTDLNLKKSIESGAIPGPKIDVTGPYLEGPGLPILFVKALRGPEDAREMVRYWAGEGATSFKAYMHISRAELSAAIEEAHARGFKLTGHLCSVTFREAASLGIDDLEHGFLVSTDFLPSKQPDVCPPRDSVVASILRVKPTDPAFEDLIRYLIDQHVAITSTLPVFETFAPRSPPVPQRVLDVMLPRIRDNYLRTRVNLESQTDSTQDQLLREEMELELAFARAGGTLLAGTDPTGYGGVIAGFANHRELELLVAAGFSPEEAIRIGTLNGARYLGRDDRVGSIQAGKSADLVIVAGDPSRQIQDVENVEIVFKDGIGYDPTKLIDSVKGEVGLH